MNNVLKFCIKPIRSLMDYEHDPQFT